MCQNSFDGNVFVITPHPPYSPDLAPSDCCLCDHIQASLAGRVFNDIHELVEAITESLTGIQRSELQLVFHHWVDRAKWV
jgi:hypothetical protein